MVVFMREQYINRKVVWREKYVIFRNSYAFISKTFLLLICQSKLPELYAVNRKLCSHKNIIIYIRCLKISSFIASIESIELNWNEVTDEKKREILDSKSLLSMTRIVKSLSDLPQFCLTWQYWKSDTTFDRHNV